MKPRCEALWSSVNPGANCQVSEVHYRDGRLEIRVLGDPASALVKFDLPYGHRVLDEQDMLEFWSVCSLKDGWLFVVKEGGWKDLESTRNGGFFSGYGTALKEFMVIGTDTCVSILSSAMPIVTAISKH